MATLEEEKSKILLDGMPYLRQLYIKGLLAMHEILSITWKDGLEELQKKLKKMEDNQKSNTVNNEEKENQESKLNKNLFNKKWKKLNLDINNEKNNISNNSNNSNESYDIDKFKVVDNNDGLEQSKLKSSILNNFQLEMQKKNLNTKQLNSLRKIENKKK